MKNSVDKACCKVKDILDCCTLYMKFCFKIY